MWKELSRLAWGGILLASLAGAPALALGPIDGEVGAVWWANDFDAETGDLDDSADGDAPGFRGELWFKKYGLRAAMYSSDTDDLNIDQDSSDYMSVDLMWKAFAPTENNYVAVGLGWEELDILDSDTSGVRLSAEGRIGILSVLHAYGHASYLPSMDDTSSSGFDGRFEDIDGLEYEVGISWKMAPFISMRAGYRETSFDFDFDPLEKSDPEVASSIESTGFLLGLGFHF